MSASRPTVTAPKAHTHGNSFASSTMSRSGSKSSRTGFSATVGSGAHPPSAISRPRTSLDTRKLQNSSIQRPATSLDTHTEEGAGSVLGKRKGMRSFHSPHYIFFGPVLSPITLDGPAWWNPYTHVVSTPEFGIAKAKPLDFSVFGDSTALSHNSSPGSCLVLDPKPDTPAGPGGLSKVLVDISLKSVQIKSMSPRRMLKKPPIPWFLSKDSSLTSFDHNTGTEWDQDTREKHMDEMFMAFMSRMNQQGQETSGLKDTVEIYKSRSKWQVFGLLLPLF